MEEELIKLKGITKSYGKPIYYLIAAICYIILPLFLSVKLFEKKELEF